VKYLSSDPLSTMEKRYCMLLHRLNTTLLNTINQMVDQAGSMEIFMLSRSIFESTLHMGLLAANGLVQDAAKRYVDYTKVETVKTLDHIKKLGLGDFFHIDVDMATAEKLVTDCVNNYGEDFEEHGWSGFSTKFQVIEVDKYYEAIAIPGIEKKFYAFMYCQLYKIASSVLHQSYAGVARLHSVNIDDTTMPHSEIRVEVRPELFDLGMTYSLLTYISSMRFFGAAIGEKRAEKYFQQLLTELMTEDFIDPTPAPGSMGD